MKDRFGFFADLVADSVGDITEPDLRARTLLPRLDLGKGQRHGKDSRKDGGDAETSHKAYPSLRWFRFPGILLYLLSVDPGGGSRKSVVSQFVSRGAGLRPAASA
jgi:hypothetical protein